MNTSSFVRVVIEQFSGIADGEPDETTRLELYRQTFPGLDMPAVIAMLNANMRHPRKPRKEKP